ncbi:MAG: hypothetical protein RBU29_06060, partial [bacterium]|nr:hypothetical protein [bacterium]
IPGFPAVPLSQGFVVLNTATPAQCILYPSAQPFSSGETTPSTAFWHWPIQSRVSIDPDTISFARLTYPHFKQTLAEAKNILRAYPSFQGFAIHDAQHFQALISSAKQ